MALCFDFEGFPVNSALFGLEIYIYITIKIYIYI